MSGVYDILLKTTIISSGLIVVIMCIKRIMADKLSLKWHYCIWFLLVIKLVIPVSIPSSLSIYNVFGTSEGSYKIEKESLKNKLNSPLITEDQNGFSRITTQGIQPKDEKINNDTMYDKSILENSLPVTSAGDNKVIWVVLWLVGIVIMGGITLLHNYRIRYMIMNSLSIEDVRIHAILEACKDKLGIKDKVQIKWVRGISSPAISGMKSPTILLPIAYRDNLPDRLDYILLHELVHYKRRDVTILHILAILQVIYWFNPLVWIAFHKMRQEMEMCCDEGVIQVVGNDHKRAYGKLIINLIEMNAHTPMALPALLGGHKAMKARLNQLMKNHKTTKYSIGLGIGIICLLLVFFMTSRTDKKQQEDKPIISSNENDQKQQDKSESISEEDQMLGIIGGADGPTAMFTATEVQPVMLSEMDIQELQLMVNGVVHKTITDHEAIVRLGRNLDANIGVRSDMGVKEFYDTISIAHHNKQPVTLIIDYTRNEDYANNKIDRKYEVKVEAGDLTANYTMTRYNILFHNLLANPTDTYDYHLPKDIKALADRYELNIGYHLITVNITLPESYDYYIGENPVQLYWAYKNEFIKAIGMDITDYLGKEIELSMYTFDDMYKTATTDQQYKSPNRFMIVRYQEEIVGAYLQDNVHHRNSYTLSGASFEQVNDTTFNTWVDQFVVMTEETKALAGLTPKEVVETYYVALEKKDFKKANQLVAISTLFDPGIPFKDDFAHYEYYDMQIDNLKLNHIGKSKVLKDGTYQFAVDLDVQLKENALEHTYSGQWVEKEQEKVGYKVKAMIGTGDSSTHNEE